MRVDLETWKEHLMSEQLFVAESDTMARTTPVNGFEATNDGIKGGGQDGRW